MDIPPTFFASLAQDERHAIARRLSAKPRSDEWREHVSRVCIHLLLNRRGPFAHDIGPLFPTIWVSEEDIHSTDLSDPALVKGVDDFVDLKVLETLGDHLTNFVADVAFDQLPSPIQSHLMRSTGLKTLDLSSSGSNSLFLDAICANASTLESLILKGVQENFNKLPSNIAFPSLHNFEFDDLVWSRCSKQDMGHIMEVLGPFLSSITWTIVKDETIPTRCPQYQLLDVIQEHCPDLSRFVILPGTRVADCFPTNYARFLASYGAQIMRASLDIFDRDMGGLRNVLEQCPNLLSAMVFVVRIPGVDAMHFSDIEQLMAIAPRLREIYVLYPISIEVLEFDMTQCNNLRMVWACLPPAELITLFSTPIQSLEIAVCLWTGSVKNEEVFEVLARSTVHIKSLHFEGKIEGKSASASLLSLMTGSRCLETLRFKLRMDEWNTFVDFCRKLGSDLSTIGMLRMVHFAILDPSDDYSNSMLADCISDALEVFRCKDTLITVGDKVFFS